MKKYIVGLVLVVGLTLLPMLGLSQLEVSPLVLPNGLVWVWDAYFSNSAQHVPTPGLNMSASFDDQGNINGFAGCNTYFGGYSVDATNLSISSLGTTRKFCIEPAGVMDLEGVFLAKLSQAVSYDVVGNRLAISVADGQSGVLRFEARAVAAQLPEGPSTPLPEETPVVGNIWLLESWGVMSNLQPPLLGTYLALIFPGDDLLVGFGGCNVFQGTVMLPGGNQVRIVNLAATRKYCSAPDRVMEQEAAFLNVLTSVESFSQQGDSLQIFWNNGSGVMNFKAQPEVVQLPS